MSDIAERIALLPPEKRALLAARLARSKGPVHGVQQIPIRERGFPAPLSYNQRSVWFLDQLYPGNVAYNSGNAVRFSGRLDPNALEWSWNELIRRHDLLRTVFELREGDAMQYAKPFRPVRLRRMELGQLPESERLEAAREEAVREAQLPFDLASGPPWRARLLCCSEREHVLVVILHHIICDGWSIGVLVRELVAGYEAFLKGGSAPLPELPIQYADYAVWQREQLAGPGFQRHVELWRQRLEGVTGAMQVPLDKPRPTEATFRGARIFTQLSPQLAESLRRIAHAEGATLFMVLLGAFKVLLSRYSGESDIIVGSQIANRERSELESLIGFFANTLALRTDLSGDPTFLELLARVRDTALGAYDSQEVPFRKLVEELKPEKHLNRNPFFDIDFNFRNLPLHAVNVPDLNVGLLRIDNGTSKFDLSMEFAEVGSGLEVAVEYSTELFHASTPARLLKNYQTLLEGIVANPKTKISRLPLLTEAERNQILVEWNQTTAEPASERCVHELFEDQVRRTPDAIAVIFGNQQLSYQELNSRANRLAHHLIERGAKPEIFVGIMLDRSIEMIVAILATLKTGAAYLPLDSEYPRARLAQILTDAMPKVVLANARLCTRLPETVEALALDTREAEIMLSLAPVENPTDSEQTNLSAHAAYLIYTSGSTGTPKGVVIEHAALSTYSRTVAAHYELSSADRVLQFASLSFDAAVEEIFPTLIVGASLVMRRHDIWTTWECRQKIRELGITVLNLPTAYWEQLVQDWANDDDKASTNVRLVVVGGEAMRPQGVAWWQRTPLRSSRLVNTYGPTEATVVATAFEVPPTAYLAARVPVGKPLPGRLAYVLDGNLEPVPVGVSGDLYLGGTCLARGYLNQQGLTAERFVADPHRPKLEARMYQTGDRARWLPDGNIEFIERSDRQIKFRGFRIELGEVEVALRRHPGVRDAVVIAREDEPAQRQLVAYIVSGKDSAPADLRSFLEGKLPSYMIPQAFVELDALPMTTSGKLDRKALPKPQRPLEGYRAPRTPEEEMLCAIYADSLSLEQVGIDDNFFSLGGHSLLAMRLVSRVRSAFGVELALRAVFEAPTVAELIGRLPGTRKGSVALTRQERPERVPLSFAQQRLWFSDQYEPNSSIGNMPSALGLKGPLNLGALEQSFNEIIRRHESLRTTFSSLEGKAVQVIAPSLRISLDVVDLRDHAQGEEEAMRLAQEEARRPFDLARGPLFRSKLLRLGEDDHVLLLTMHHIVSDGWSMGIFSRELSVLYRALVTGESSALPELPIQYADFAVWQREWLKGEVLERQLSYWKKQLAGAPVRLELPTDRPRPAVQSFHGARQTMALPQALTNGLKALSRQEGVTLFMTLLAAFQTLLHRHSGENDIVVGSPIAGREHTQIEGLIGFFVNTLALRTDFSGDPSFRELLARVRTVALDAYSHQDLPFEKLVEALHPHRNSSHSPLFQVFFALQNDPLTKLTLAGLTVDRRRVDRETATFDLSLVMTERTGCLNASIEYNTDLFDGTTITRMIGHFQALLEGIASNPNGRLSELPLLTQAEKQQLLVEWNDTKRDYVSDNSIHELFEARVDQSPDAVAVIFEDKEVTYRELNARANQLAHYLRNLAVGPETLVGICMERSLEMVIGLLGILKAGGAYLPLDPVYPQERLAFMLADSQAPVVLTESKLLSQLPKMNDDGRTATGDDARSSFPQRSVLISPRCSVVCLDTDGELIARESKENPFRVANPENLAYVIYTSGSTGKPKGALINHANVTRLLHATHSWFHFDQNDVWTLFHSYAFDFSVWEMWGALLYGGRLVVVPYWVSRTPEKFYKLLSEKKVTVLNQTPSAFRQLIRAEESSISRDGLELRIVIFGGEALDFPTLRPWFDRHGDQHPRLVNMYGITETTVHVTYRPITAADLTGSTASLIGLQIPDLEVYVLDQNQNPVPIGVRGELYVGGAGVGRGYLNRPDLTAERFIPDPFRPGQGQRLYRSGDLVRYLPNRDIEYLGRIDAQIKIRGFRIELGEIEATLSQHPSVQDVVVVLHEDGPTEKRLVAYMVSTEQAPTISELNGFLRQKLPEYMVPASFVFLDALPLTTNGKVDRRNLPAPDQRRPEQESPFVAPRTPVEELLAKIWDELLKVERVGIHDNFFELGGHSLLITQVASRIEQAFQVHLPLRTLFDAPTIAHLSVAIATAQLGQEDAAEAVHMLDELKNLSAEEVKALLEAECGLSASEDNQ
ncbi:MAG TPA: amino acid adenylation domain-containing protein [Terrimicrobiaceae bacterium]